MFAIEINQLVKQIDGRMVLRNLDLHIPAGSIYGLVGPAGAGKTTLLLILLGFLRPDHGSIRVLEQNNLQQVRNQIGYLPQSQRYHGNTSVREYLRFLGQCNQIKSKELNQRIADELRVVGLLDFIDMPLDALSPSQKQRFGLAQALLAKPSLILLDAPSTGAEGLDANFLDLLSQLRERGQTILITTQRLDEAEYLCDTIGILVNGQLATEAATRSLRGPGRNVLISVDRLPTSLAAQLMSLSPAIQCEGDEIAIAPNMPSLQAQVLQQLLDAKATIIAIEPFGRPIEELYLRAVRGLPLNQTASAPIEAPIEATEPAMIAPTEVLAEPEVAVSTEPTNPPEENHPPAVVPGRPGTGDTLLRELLKHEDQ